MAYFSSSSRDTHTFKNYIIQEEFYSRKPGDCLNRVCSRQTVLFALGFLLTAIWSISSALTLASSRQYLTALDGNPAQCLTRRKRSSSAAAINLPSTTIQADESPWSALRPRIIIVLG